MIKSKYLAIAGGIVAVIGAGGGYWVWHGHKNTHQNKKVESSQTTYDSNGQTLTQTSDPNSIPLNQTVPTPKSSGGLSVAPSSAENNLGQITPNSDGSTKPPSGSSSTPKALDPATFGQYDKYKDGNGALFGEMQIGSGDELTAGKKAAVYYKGWLTNGQLFDMTRADKDGKLQPFVFEMGAHQVIPGWEQGLIGMKVGGTRLLIVPPVVGYGAAGQAPIPGNAVLVFQVQLLAVQ